MLKEERHNYILNEVRIHHRVMLGDVADSLKVSVDTIRRDVKELDSDRLLKKVHGGAVSLDYNIYNYVGTETYLQQNKVEIAKKAVKLLKDGQYILISGGTTNIEVIKQLPHNIKLTIFTPSLPIATQLLQNPSVDVILIGGLMSKESQISVGADTINALNQIKVDYCFLGTGYLSSEDGLTEYDYQVVQVKKAMIRAAKKTIILSVSAKLNSTQRFKTCDVKDVDTLITELSPKDPKLDGFRKLSIKIL